MLKKTLAVLLCLMGILSMTGCSKFYPVTKKENSELITKQSSSQQSISENSVVSSETKSASSHSNKNDLFASWQDWEKIAQQKGYVYPTDKGTINLETLEKWIEAYKNRKVFSVTILILGSTYPLVYTLTSDGSDVYKVKWSGNDQNGEYKAKGIYSRNTDYVFEESLLKGYKETMAVNKKSCNAKKLPYNKKAKKDIGKITLKQAEEIAVRVQKSVEQYFTNQKGISDTGIRIAKPVDVLKSSQIYLETTKAIELYGHPCYVVDFYSGKQAFDDKMNTPSDYSIAINADGGNLAFYHILGKGSWSLVYDGNEEYILPKTTI